jgi:hypothetical protein
VDDDDWLHKNPLGEGPLQPLAFKPLNAAVVNVAGPDSRDALVALLVLEMVLIATAFNPDPGPLYPDVSTVNVKL